MLSLQDRQRRLTEASLSLNLSISKPIEKKVFGYIRVSTDKQELNGIGLDVQEDTIRNYCKTFNFPIPTIISEDKAISGRDINNRPEYLKMKNQALPGETIIVYSLCRLNRNTIQFLSFVEEMKAKFVRVIIIKSNIDINYENGIVSPSSQFTLVILGGAAEFEAAQTRMRVKGAMDKLNNDGTLRTKPPFGYHYITNDKNQRVLAEVPDQQAVIQFILEKINLNKKVSIADLTHMVNEKITLRELSYKGKPKVWHSQITKIVSQNNLRGDL